VLKVNWRPGTTSVYESIWSLRRKFSYLNRLNGGLTDDAIRADSDGVDGDIDLGNPMLKCLGEPLQIFRDCSLSRFLLPIEITGHLRRFHVSHLRYCEMCIVRGYHSPIHQLPWVACCPIHGIPLRELCLDCGKPIAIRSWANGKPDSRFKNSHPDYCCCNPWPGMLDSQWPLGLKRSDVRPIGAYLRWVNSLLSLPEARSAEAALRNLQLPLWDNALHEEFFHVWRQILPPPDSIEIYLSKRSVNAPVKTKIVMPTGVNANELLDIVRTVGFVTIKEGLVNQLANIGDKGTWEYYAKRFARRVAQRMHRNCHQVLQRKVQREFFHLSSIDVAAELYHECPRSALIELIRSPALSLEWTTSLSAVGRTVFASAQTTWLDARLIEIGLATTATSADRLNFKQKLGQRFGEQYPSKAIWCDELCRFASHLMSAGHIAAVSRLFHAYTDFYKSRSSKDGIWDQLITSRDVRWPYVIVVVESTDVLTVTIWFRHKPLEAFAFDGLQDAHLWNIKTYLKKLTQSVAYDFHTRVGNAFASINNSNISLNAEQGSSTSRD